MCYHPIKIRNPSLFFNEEIDKPYIEVPCGHCEQCAKNKVNDLVVRSYYQWQCTLQKGGFCFFDTLTYSNESVPKLFGIMTFSRDHLTKFFKRLRISLERSGFSVCDENKHSNLTYLVTTEYGEDDRYTHRPHYHILWFCSIPGLTLFKFYAFVRKVWTYEMKLGWNDKITDVMRHVVNRIDGIRYVCKYLTKSSDYLDRLNNLLKTYENDVEKSLVIIKNIKNIKPFYRASLGFGSSILEVSYDKLHDFGVPVMTTSGMQFYPIPKYIKYKIHYDKINHPLLVGQKLYRRNQIGKEYLADKLDEVIDSKVLQYKSILENESVFTDEFYNIKQYVLSLLGTRSIRDFIVYKTIYKGHMFSDLSFKDYQDYYNDWLHLPRIDRSPLITKSDCEAYLSIRDHAIITDKSKVEFFDFDEIDCQFDYLLDVYNFWLEKQAIVKKQENEKVGKIYKRFCQHCSDYHLSL